MKIKKQLNKSNFIQKIQIKSLFFSNSMYHKNLKRLRVFDILKKIVILMWRISAILGVFVQILIIGVNFVAQEMFNPWMNSVPLKMKDVWEKKLYRVKFLHFDGIFIRRTPKPRPNLRLGGIEFVHGSNTFWWAKWALIMKVWINTPKMAEIWHIKITIFPRENQKFERGKSLPFWVSLSKL